VELSSARLEMGQDPRPILDNALLLKRIQELAMSIPGQQGVILRLRLLAGLPNKAIAAALGLKEPNVRMHLTKALRRLRTML
jgi:RNA polymerase sigma factor (sigma-70 family)